MSRLRFDILKHFQFFDFSCFKLLKDHLFLSDKKFFLYPWFISIVNHLIVVLCSKTTAINKVSLFLTNDKVTS